jgi:hypothetical protein
MTQTARLPTLEPAMFPCPFWCQETHEPVKLENDLDGAVVDHVLPIGEIMVPDYYKHESGRDDDAALACISVEVVTSDWYSVTKQDSSPPRVRLAIDNHSMEVFDLDMGPARELGELLMRAGGVLEEMEV